MLHRWVTGSSMDKVKRSELVWVVFLGLVALIVPALAGYVVFDQFAGADAGNLRGRC